MIKAERVSHRDILKLPFERDGYSLSGVVNLSSTGSRQDPLIIFVAGASGKAPEDKRYTFMAQHLATQGFNSARLYYARDVTDRSDMTLESDIKDIEAFRDNLRENHFNVDDITFVGKSIGCVPLLSRRIAGKKHMILLAPTIILDENVTQDAMNFTWSQREEQGRETIVSNPQVIRGETAATLILHGTNDPWHMTNSYKLVGYLKKSGIPTENVDVVQGATHHFDRQVDKTYLVARIKQFIDSTQFVIP